MLFHRPPFSVVAGALFGLLFSATFALGPFDAWLAHFSPHATVFDAVVNSLYVDFSPVALERGRYQPPDAIHVASHTHLGESAVRPLELARWIEAFEPGMGDHLAARLITANRLVAPTVGDVHSRAAIRLVPPDSVTLVASRRLCRHHHDLHCGLSGPLTLSRPAFSSDGSIALVHTEEAVGAVSTLGTFFLLELTKHGWAVVAWWDAWASWTDEAGQVRETQFES